VIKNWKLWLGLAISAVALYFTLRNVHFDEFIGALSSAQLIWFLPATASLFVTLCFRAWRWSSLMGGTPFAITFHALNIGYMLNSILPFRLGEIGRTYVIGERTSVRMTRALSTVVVERMLDLAAVVLLFALFAQFIPMPPNFSQAALLGAAVVIFLVVVFALVIWQATRVETLLNQLASRVKFLQNAKLVQRFHDIVSGFHIIRSPRTLAANIALTAAVWATSLAVAYCCMMAFFPASLDMAGLTMVLSNLGGALPSAPGGLGVVQFFAKQALVLPFQVPEGVAVAFAFTWSLYQILVLILLGLIGLLRVGMSFASVTASSRQLEAGQ
jgi:glycosyltransferase 2 family protein